MDFDLENLGHFGLRIRNISELHGHNINGVGTLKEKPWTLWIYIEHRWIHNKI
jgi:hypothetical protein